MISVKEAQDLILWDGSNTSSQQIFLSESLGRILADDVISEVPQPLFDNSAVDGYALRIQDLRGDDSKLELVGEIKAGDSPNVVLEEHQSVRIFTGAAVPPSADTVVMQEQVTRVGKQITITKNALKKTANIRMAGEQLEAGGIALAAGTVLNASSIGFLASIGIQKVRVSQVPKIGLIISGNEFLKAEDDPAAGKIYESNGIMLQNAIRQTHTGEIDSYVLCPDTLKDLRSMIASKTEENDVMLITGGVSVGDYDFTLEALKQEGFEIVFHKVNQKPGKPLLFARRHDKVAFGLPGNPLAALICFYEYVYPHLRSRMGCTKPFLRSISWPLAKDFKRKPGKEQFIAAFIKRDGLILKPQGSHMLKGFSEAEGIAVLDAATTEFRKGEMIEFHFLT